MYISLNPFFTGNSFHFLPEVFQYDENVGQQILCGMCVYRKRGRKGGEENGGRREGERERVNAREGGQWRI